MANTYGPDQTLGNLMSRLDSIRNVGQFQPNAKLPEATVPDWARDAVRRSAGPVGLMGTQTRSGGYGPVGGGSDTLSRLVRAIRQQESSNNYGARNRDSGALGAYQIMPSNLGGNRSGWDFEALGRDVSISEFMSSPQIQDAIARYKLSQYLKQYGDAGAAVAWYGGPGSVKNMYSTKTQTGGYPSLYAYWQSVLSKM